MQKGQTKLLRLRAILTISHSLLERKTACQKFDKEQLAGSMIDLRNTGKLMILTNLLYHSLLMCSSRIILTLRETGLCKGAESWSVFSSHPRLEEIQVLLSLLSSRVTGVYLMFVKTSSIRVRRNSFHVTESRGEVSLRSYLSRSSVLDIFPI